MSNGLTRLASRFLGRSGRRSTRPKPNAARCSTPKRAEKLGLVTFALDDIDWDDEVRVFLEERASFSPDGAHRPGSQSALRRAGDDGIENLRAADRVAELDFPAPQRRRRRGRAASATAPARSRCSIRSGFETRRAAHDPDWMHVSDGAESAMNIENVDYTTKIPNNVNLTEDRAGAARAGELASGLSSTGGRTWGRKASRSRWSICAPPCRSIPRAGPSSTT